MRFGLIHRVMTDALATLGLLALVTSGELTHWVSWTLLITLAAALAVPERWQDKPAMRHFGVLAPVLLLVLQIGRFWLGISILQLAVEFAAGLQVVRLSTRRGAAHDQQVIVLALLHLIAATVLGGGLAYGLCFLGFLIVAPGALVLSHLRREVEGNYRQGARDRTGLPVDVPRILRSRRVIGKQFLVFTCLLSVPIFVFTALLFVLFPRVGLSLLLLNHSRPERLIGFSDHVDLSGVGRLRSDPTIAMRVEYAKLPSHPPLRLALYLRGTAFDRYDGHGWSRTLSRRAPAEEVGTTVSIRRFPDPQHDSKLTIDLEPIDPPVVFLPADTVAIRLAPRAAPLLGNMPRILSGPEGEYTYVSADDRGLRYEAYLAAPTPRRVLVLSPEERHRYLQLPETLPARIGALAHRWVGHATVPALEAAIVERHLRRDYKYDLDSPSGAAKNPLDDFLFNSKRGHCEYYSTAMAVLLRTLGVPTRNVTGFIGGTYNRFGHYYAVRQGDAHSWVEVYLNGRGWTRFDPTPPADAVPQSDVTGLLALVRDFIEATAQRWDRHVIGYDLRQQVELFHSVRTRYVALRESGRWFARWLSPRRLGLVILALLLAASWTVWLRRRRPTASKAQAERSRHDLAVAQIVVSYRSLEDAMAQHGVPRQPSTPPLAHARALEDMHHPIAGEAMELTQIYLDVRFGQRELSAEERRQFGERVRALRQLRDRSRTAA
jgi:protein-glutamine gamma-glutamyltransferase